MKRYRFVLLSCFFVSGLWAAGIAAYVAINAEPSLAHTAEMRFDSSFGEKFETRPRLLAPKPGRTTPYEDSTAPKFQFPAPVMPYPFTPGAPVAPAPVAPAPVAPAPVAPAPAPVAPITQAVPAPVAPAPAPVAPITDDVPPSLGGLLDSENGNQIEGVFSALQRLFSGSGNFRDILEIVIFGLALYGGANFGSSDILFKVILGLFSRKKNYNAILEDKIHSRRPRPIRNLGKLLNPDK